MPTTPRQRIAGHPEDPERTNTRREHRDDINRQFDELADRIVGKRPFGPEWDGLSELEILEKATRLTKRET